jgi:hypothetical protein
MARQAIDEPHSTENSEEPVQSSKFKARSSKGQQPTALDGVRTRRPAPGVAEARALLKLS